MGLPHLGDVGFAHRHNLPAGHAKRRGRTCTAAACCAN
jgi:hypothetical protein